MVYVTTDAPLPAAPGDPPGDVPALFDRLDLAVFEPGATEPCGGCKRRLAVDRDGVDSGAVSFGLGAAPGQGGFRVRARLYRSATTIAGSPRPASTIELVAALPAVKQDAVTSVTLVLHTDDVGRPVGDLEQPVEPLPGRSPHGLVGSYPGAVRVPCPTAPPANMACVPGGAFWMGDPTLDTTDSNEYDGRLERLVVLSPFFVDRTEVTVSKFRASGLAISLIAGSPSDNPHVPDASFPYCRYTDEPGEFESHAVNCISWHLAAKYCESLGRTLATEAQLEYLMSRLGRGPYAWGTDSPACEDAVFGREVGGSCEALGVGPVEVGSGFRDRLALDGVQVVDLTGGVTEWAADAWNRESEGCWGTGVFVNPRCDTPSGLDAPARVMRGGGWYSSASLLRAALRARTANETQAVSAAIGLRCVSTP